MDDATRRDPGPARDTTRPDTTRRDAIGHDPVPRAAVATVLGVEDAAEFLGISPGAVRKRIERGHLPGRKVGGRWQVVLDATDTMDAARPDTTGTTRPRRPDTTAPPDATRPRDATGAVSPAAVSQLEAIRDQWLAPLVVQIREQAAQIGRLEAERDAAERERARLAEQLAADRGFADQLVDLLPAERDAARRQVAELEGAQPRWWRRLRGG